MLSVPDRSLPDQNLLDDAPAIGTLPNLPFRCTPNAGYGILGVLTNNGDKASLVIEFDSAAETSTNKWMYNMVCFGTGSMDFVLCASKFVGFSSGFGSPYDIDQGFTPNWTFIGGRKYLYDFEKMDNSTLEISIYPAEGGAAIATQTVTSTGMLAEPMTINIGWPTDQVITRMREMEIGNVPEQYDSFLPYNTTIYAAGVGLPTPTDITATPVAGNAQAGAVVATLSTTEAGDPGPATFAYELVAGTGDTNNALFYISGDKVRTKAAQLAGSFSIRVKTTDLFGKNYTAAVTFATNY